MTLAIGDGANDVNMIETAHVGIGIMGKEGNRAAQFSDFAVNDFRSLRTLLFWHGTNFLYRLMQYMLIIIAKTGIYGLIQLFYNLYADFSAQSPIPDPLQFTYSAIVAQVGFFVNFETLLPARKYKYREDLLPFKLSELYANTKLFSYQKQGRNFFRFLVFTYYSAVICLAFGLNFGETITAEGKSQSLWWTGMLMFWLVALNCQGIILTTMRHFNIIAIWLLCDQLWEMTWIVMCANWDGYVPFDGTSDKVYFPMHGEMLEGLSNPVYWFYLGVALFVTILPYLLNRLVVALIINPKFNF